MTVINIGAFLTTKQKRELHEFIRVHTYRTTRRFKHDFLKTSVGTDLEKEKKFMIDNPPLHIKLIYDDIQIVIKPTIWVIRNFLKYKAIITITKQNKKINSNIKIIKDLLKK